MNKLKISIIAVIIVSIVIIGTSCDSSDEKEKDATLVISDSAMRYEFSSDNILRYKGIIVDKEFVIYVFGSSSEFVKALNNDNDMKVFSGYSNNSKRQYTTEWELLHKDSDSWYLVIYCDSNNYDFEAGLAISNFLEEDGETSDYNRTDMTTMTIRYLQNPKLLIRKLTNIEKRQSYEDGKWSSVFEKRDFELD